LADDVLKREVEPLEQGAPTSPRVEEHRNPEPPADGEPEPDVKPVVDDAEARSRLARYLDRVAFPGERGRLLESAARNRAPAEVMEALVRLPEGVRFRNAQHIWVALGGEQEERF
jgi:hypothetical protein